ncbi:MAG: phage tail family protein [Oscillospiraceae bacterium]|nr:phage tail family protein [Oscillospiraceae bacterium]
MYALRFDKDNGDQFYFDFDHNILVDLDPLSEMDVDIATSQGVSQIGSTVENRSVAGLTRVLTGTILHDANEIKEQMLTVFSPFSSGKLYFNDKYYCDCIVEKTPEIGKLHRNVEFTLSLYCAYPFWLQDNLINVSGNAYEACFKFPGPTSGAEEEYTNYDQHIYAIMHEGSFFTVHNDSEVDTRFAVYFYVITSESVSDYGIINVRTMEKIQINDTLNIYDKVKVYWDNDILKVEKTSNGVTENIFSTLDEDSDLFWLYQGDNVFQTFGSGGTPSVEIEYQNAYVGVYDGK